jgi:hypothetical protein
MAQVAPPPPPPPPAYVVALGALDQLESKQLWQNEQTKAYYSELTRILREYLEGRFDVQALEMTTRQITTKLGQRTDFDQGLAKELGKLLQLSDLVKFAQARPAVELHPEGLLRVRTFVATTGQVAEVESPALSTSPAALLNGVEVQFDRLSASPAAAPVIASVPPVQNEEE